MGLIISSHNKEKQLRGEVGKALRRITRCPVDGCDGDLWFSIGGGDPSKPWYLKTFVGHQGGLIAMYKCQKCGLSFSVNNPRSFHPPQKEEQS